MADTKVQGIAEVIFEFMKIQLGLSKLNFHNFKHHFSDTLDPLCPINDGIKDTKHLLLLCHAYDEDRRDLLNSVDVILRPHGFTVGQNGDFADIRGHLKGTNVTGAVGSSF